MLFKWKTIIVVALAVFMVIILAALVPRLFTLNKYKELIVIRLERELNRNVELDNIRFSALSGLGIELQGLRIANRPGFSKGPFIVVNKCQLRFKLIPLFSGQVSIKKGILKKVEILVERAQTGEYSIDDLLDGEIKPDGKPGERIVATHLPALNEPHLPGRPSAAKDTLLPRELKIRQGKIRFVDHKINLQHDITTTFDNLNLTLKGADSSKGIELDLNVEVGPSEKSHIHLKGRIVPPLAQLDLKKTMLDLEIKLNNFSPAPFFPYIETRKPHFFRSFIPAKISADLYLKGELNNDLVTQGQLELLYLLSHGENAEKDMTKLTLDGNISWNYLKDMLRLKEVSLTAEEMLSVKTRGILRGISQLPYLDITLNAYTFFPSRILSLIYPMGQLTVEGKSSSTLKISGPLTKIGIIGGLDLSENSIEYPRHFLKTSQVPFKADFSIVTEKDILKFKRLEVLLGKLNLKGTLGISQPKDPLIHADMDFGPYDLASLASIFLPFTKYKLSGVAEGGFSLDGKIKEPRGIDIDSEVYLKGVHITAPQIPLRIKDLGDITGFIYFADKSLNFKDLSFHAGDSSFVFSTARWELFNHRPKISFNLQGRFLNLDELIFSDKTSHTPQAQDVSVAAIPQSKDMPKTPESNGKKGYPPFLYHYNINGKIQEGKVKIGGIYLKDLSADIALKESKLQWSEFYTRGFDGEIRSIGAIDFNKDIPEYQITSNLSQLNIIPFMGSFTNLGRILSGRLSSDFELVGKGFTKDSLQQELSGTGNLLIANGRIANVNILGNLIGKGDLEKQLKWKMKSAKETFMSMPQYTDFDKLSGKWNLTRAKISLEELHMQSPDLFVSARGILGLDQSLNLNGTSFLSPEKTNQLIVEKYRPYLTDRQGSLEIPFAILGTLKDPIVAPDRLSFFRKREKDMQLKEKMGKEMEKIMEDILQPH